jgi:hypothetical protein
MDVFAGRGRGGRLRKGVALTGAALLAVIALLSLAASHRPRRGVAGSSAMPMTPEEAAHLARERAAADHVLGIYLEEEPPRRVWMVEVELDPLRRAEVGIDPTTHAVVSYAIRTAPDVATDPAAPRP